MLLAILYIVVGLLVLIGGGEAMLRGAVGLARLCQLTPAVIGLTVVAIGTSVPELAVAIVASIEGKNDLLVGNVVGSNSFNIAVILGLCGLIRPLITTGNTARLEYPVLLLVSLMFLAVAEDGGINWLDAILFVTFYVAFTAYLVVLVREQLSGREKRELIEETAVLTEYNGTPARLVRSLLFVGIGIALLGVGAYLTVEGASELGRRVGMSERVIGLTIVAMGTGLPEVVTCIVSCLRGRVDVAIGNVIGSNLFNVLGVLGLNALFHPIPISESIRTWDNVWMMGFTLLLLPVVMIRQWFGRFEAVLFLSLYGYYLSTLLNRGG